MVGNSVETVGFIPNMMGPIPKTMGLKNDESAQPPRPWQLKALPRRASDAHSAGRAGQPGNCQP